MQNSPHAHIHDYHWYKHWSKRSHPINFATPPQSGHQIFHADIDDKPMWDDPLSVEYANKHMSEAKKFSCDAHILKYAVELALEQDGAFLEFGVWSGMTTNFIAGLAPYQTLHAFDSFQGLPADRQAQYPKKTFGLHPSSELPALLPNTQLHIGLFEDTLPPFVKEILGKHPIAFAHIDVNMYSSAKTIFKNIQSHLKPGSILLLDEYLNFNDWKDHEYRAFQEFILNTDLEYKYMAYNDCHTQVVIQVQ